MSTTRKRDDAELPDGWQMVRLGDVAEVNPKRPPLDCQPQDAVTFLPMSSIAEGLGGIDERDHRPYADVAKGYTYFEENDVLFAKITPCLQNGKHALATGLFRQFGFGTTEFHVVRAGRAVDNRFLFKTLTRPMNIEKCVRSFTGTAGQQRVQPEVLRALQMSLPPLPEQRAIADVLDSIDDAIERTEAVIAATETLRDSLLHELLTRGVPGWHAEWKDVPGIGTIPTDWEVVRLGEVLDSTTYGTNEQLGDAGNRVVLRMNNIQQGEIDFSEVKRAELAENELNDLDLRSGDILFNRTNSLDLVGKIGMIRDVPEPVSFASYLVRLRTKTNRARPTWLAALLGSSIYQSRIRRFATPGVSQANVNPTSLRSLTIPLPSIVEQANMIAVLDGVREQLQRNRRELQALQYAKSALADALLNGRARTGLTQPQPAG